MTYRMDRTHEEVAAVVESDCRMKIPNTTSVFLGAIGLLGCLCYYAFLGDINGEVTFHLLRLFIILLLLGQLAAPRIHWTSAIIAFIAGSLWLCFGFRYVWSWYLYAFDVISAALILALLFLSYADWHFGKPHRFLYVANGELTFVSPGIEIFELMRVSYLDEEKVLLKEPLEWTEDYEGYVLRLPIEKSEQVTYIQFRLGTRGEIEYLEAQGIELKEVQVQKNPFASLVTHDLKYCAVASMACLLGLIILPVELQLYRTSVTSQLLHYHKGEVLPMYKRLHKATRLQPFSSILFVWKAKTAAELGEYEVACSCYQRALKLSSEDGQAGRLLKTFRACNSFLFCKRATRLSGGACDIVRAYLANYRELNPADPRPESLLKQSIHLLQSSREASSTALLIGLRGHIEFRRYLVHSDLFSTSAQSRLKDAIALANEESDVKTLARIYFNYDQFGTTTKVLQGSLEVKDRLMLASAGRYLGKSEKELTDLIEPFCRETAFGREARMLKALILAQFGKVSESRRMLLAENSTAAKLLSALVCSQQASRVLDQALKEAHYNAAHNQHLKPSFLPVAVLSADDNVLAELCRFEWMSSVDLEHLVALQKEKGFARLGKLDWYPYHRQASLLVQNSAD